MDINFVIALTCLVLIIHDGRIILLALLNILIYFDQWIRPFCGLTAITTISSELQRQKSK